MERRKRAAWEDLQRRLDGWFDGAIEVLCAPELYVEVSSWDERNMRNSAKGLRVYAARAGALAYVFEQTPGSLTYDTVAFTVTECDPRRLADAVEELLPRVEVWRDVAGDGRYVMSLDEPPFAVGTNRRMLVERIQKDIDNLMQRLETHWELGRPEDRY
ncbi:ESX secretion-associated protein EspG [Nocardia sp. NPDC051052]|uniref:ESX secretion-associated protein EspG n=1 Tax=Nocardia sp. NPDC051052 TaxID=3364322 RepID=UPI0037991206